MDSLSNAPEIIPLSVYFIAMTIRGKKQSIKITFFLVSFNNASGLKRMSNNILLWAVYAKIKVIIIIVILFRASVLSRIIR